MTGCETLDFAKFLPSINEGSGISEEEISVIVEMPVLNDQLNEFITLGEDGAVKIFENTPWGSGREIMVKGKYNSASGQRCRELKLINIPESHQQRQFVCQQNFGNWVPLRCISR